MSKAEQQADMDAAGGADEAEREMRRQCPPHSYAVIACDGDTDVVQCSKCFHQYTAPCNFDDDYS